jgi:hypothetical protein
MAGEESIDLAVVERPDPTPAELGSDPAAVPVRQ